MLRKLSVPLVIIALSGCAEIAKTWGKIESDTALSQIRAMSRADLENAIHKADPGYASRPAGTIDLSAPDPSGAMCWEALLPITSNLGNAIGVATEFENARLAALAVHGSCSGILGPFLGAVPVP
jgi:hypothetical protein